MVGARDGLSHHPREAYSQGLRRSLLSAEVHDEPEVVVPVWPPAPPPERGGDVAGRRPALPHGVLGCGWRDLAWPREVGDGGAIAQGEHLGEACNREVLVHDEASSVERQAQGGD